MSLLLICICRFLLIYLSFVVSLLHFISPSLVFFFSPSSLCLLVSLLQSVLTLSFWSQPYHKFSQTEFYNNNRQSNSKKRNIITNRFLPTSCLVSSDSSDALPLRDPRRTFRWEWFWFPRKRFPVLRRDHCRSFPQDRAVRGSKKRGLYFPSHVSVSSVSLSLSPVSLSLVSLSPVSRFLSLCRFLYLWVPTQSAQWDVHHRRLTSATASHSFPTSPYPRLEEEKTRSDFSSTSPILDLLSFLLHLLYMLYYLRSLSSQWEWGVWERWTLTAPSDPTSWYKTITKKSIVRNRASEKSKMEYIWSEHERK